MLLSIIFVGCSLPEAQKSKPNIVLLLADDMGYGDVNFIGNSTETPNLNRLASEGVFFENFYSAAPNCSPSRAGLLTGKAPEKVGMYSYRPPNHPMHLPDEEITLAELLKDDGYQTAHFGKWHLGALPQNSKLNHPQPLDQGFDYSFGTEMNALPSHHNPINFVRNGKPLGLIDGYACQIVSKEGIDWISQRNENEPFFAYFAFHEPHSVVASPKELVDKYNTLPKKDAEYLANIDHLDMAIGKILDYLSVNNLIENTIIIFSSDNGSYRVASNGGLRAGKSSLYEGGIHVPGIIRWSGITTEKKVIDTPTGFVDIVPTFCDILGINTPSGLDGTSMLPLLKENNFVRKRPLYWFFYRTIPEIAVRVGDYMILGLDNDTLPRSHSFAHKDWQYILSMSIKDYELYNLKKDFSQQQNIFKNYPKKDTLKRLLNKQLIELQTNMFPWQELPKYLNKRQREKMKWAAFK
tara:strand:+ start:843 stop:2240 length:1398 start_codon:yes stop_codon:yes gene_type:complete